MRVTVWGEPLELSAHPKLRALQGKYHATTLQLYEAGIEGAVAAALREQLSGGATIRTASLDEPDYGLPPHILNETDVLVWWSHARNDVIPDALAGLVQDRVRLDGMGFVALHSALESKPFTGLMGTTCRAERWRHGDDEEAVWTVNPSHEIARGLPPVFVIPQEEMYCEFLDIPQPDELVFISSFSGGEVCRSGCGFYRGKGRIFYFRPGHEAHPTFHQREVQQIIANAVTWACNASPSTAAFPLDWESREGPVGWYRSLAE